MEKKSLLKAQLWKLIFKECIGRLILFQIRFRILLPIGTFILFSFCGLTVSYGQTSSVTGFNLINSSTDQAIQPLVSGTVLNLAALPTRRVNIQAVTSPSTVGSVVFNLSGQESKIRIDNHGPQYSLQGDNNGDYYSWTPTVGTYTLTAGAYAAANGTGSPGGQQTITFTVIDQFSVTGFNLINSSTDQAIQPLQNGTILNLATLPTRRVNIQAVTNPSTVGSVVFNLSGQESKVRIDNHGPHYSLQGDNNGDYYSWTPAVGTYTLTAGAYANSNGNGTPGGQQTITFTVIDQISPVMYNLNITTSGSGTVAKNPNQASYENGATVTLTATPDAGFQFAGWSGDATGNTNPLVVVMNSNKNITATFTATTAQFTLTVAVNGSGSVAKSPDQPTYVSGSTVMLTAIPDAGFQFSGWSGDASGNVNPLSVTMNSNKNITANFVEDVPDLIVPFGATWKYLDNGTNQGSAWTGTAFDDSGWSSGPAKLGYGISDAVTTVSYGPNSNNKYITTYFRKTINITDPAQFFSYTGSVVRDDGVRVFINGQEVYRNNLPAGTIAYNTLASSSSGSTTICNFSIAKTAFVAGANVIAVEVHQVSATSSDIGFDLKITGNPVELTRGPYLQMGSQTGVTFRWRTNTPTDSKIEVGTIFGTYTLAATNPTITTEHEVRINNLTPGTWYYYRFGSTSRILQASSDNRFKTAPPANSTDKIRIAAFGDAGQGKEADRLAVLNAYLNYVGTSPAELMLPLGDLAYDTGSDAEYQARFFKTFSPTILKNHIMFPTPGNHDYDVQSSRSDPYFQNFTMPTAGESGGVPSGTEAYYSYNWGNIHFISLDSYGTEGPNNTRLYDTLGTQVTWLKQDIAANQSKWIIAYWHHPPYTMGSHNSDTEGQLVRIRQNFIRILERNGVDLVLGGHSHAYERSYLLNNYYGSETSFNPSLHAVSTSSANYNGTTNSCPYVTTSNTGNHGTVYIEAGSAGYTGDVQSAWRHNAMPFSFNNIGMFYLEVTDNRLDGKFIRGDGVIADQFTIMKDVNKTTTKTIALQGSVSLEASWIGSYRWSTGETTRTITVSPTQDTNYTVTDSLNCLTDVFDIKVISSANRYAETGSITEADELPFLFPSQVQRGESISVKINPQEEMKMMIYNNTGTLINTTTFSGATFLDTGNLSAGLYLVKMLGKDKILNKKFIVTN